MTFACLQLVACGLWLAALLWHCGCIDGGEPAKSRACLSHTKYAYYEKIFSNQLFVSHFLAL